MQVAVWGGKVRCEWSHDAVVGVGRQSEDLGAAGILLEALHGIMHNRVALKMLFVVSAVVLIVLNGLVK